MPKVKPIFFWTPAAMNKIKRGGGNRGGVNQASLYSVAEKELAGKAKMRNARKTGESRSQRAVWRNAIAVRRQRDKATALKRKCSWIRIGGG